jgi:hypothetical protein
MVVVFSGSTIGASQIMRRAAAVSRAAIRMARNGTTRPNQRGGRYGGSLLAAMVNSVD